MFRRLLGAAAIAVSLLLSAAIAHQPGWQSCSRTVEPLGRYYVVVSRPFDDADHRCLLTLAEGRDRLPVAARADLLLAAAAGGCGNGIEGQYDVRQGDAVRCRFMWPQKPDLIKISSAGSCFAGLWLPAKRGELAQPSVDGDALIIVASSGEIRSRMKLGELFSAEELALVVRSDESIAWPWSVWFDDVRRQLVIVGESPAKASRPPPVRLIDLDSGAVTAGSRDIVAMTLLEMNRPALYTALSLAVYWNLDVVRPAAERIVDDDDSPRFARLYAAELLHKQGDSRGAALVAETIRAWQDQHYFDVHFAISLGPEILGMECVLVLREASLGSWLIAHLEAPHALAKLGPDVIPHLIEMLGDAKTAEALGYIGPEAKTAVPALRRFACRAKARLEQVQCRSRTPSPFFDAALHSARADHYYANNALEKICGQ